MYKVNSMRPLFFLSVVLLLGISSCKKQQEDILKSIKEQTEKTDAHLKDYSLRQVDDIVSPENGAITGYYRDEEVRKVLTQHFGEKSRSFKSYYFNDGNLIYVESRDYIYNKPNTYTEEVAKSMGDSIWYDDAKTRLEINRYYFNDNNLIKWTGADKTDVPINVADFTMKEPVIIAGALLAIKQLDESE